MSNFSSYVKGVGSGYLNMLIINVVGLALTPFILKFLTKEEFALFYLAGDLLMWLSLAQLGVSSSYNSRASQLFGKNDNEELKKLTSSALGLQLLSSVLIVIIGIIMSYFVNSFFEIKDGLNNVQSFFIVLVVAAAAQVLGQVFSALLVSSKLINIDNRIKLISILPKILFTILFLLAGWKIVGLALANLIASITPVIISIAYVKNRFPAIHVSLNNWTKRHTGELLMDGIWFTVGGVAGILILGMDRIVIAKVVSLEIVASFLITQKLYFLTDKVLSQIFNVTRPFMGQIYGAGNYQRLYDLYKLFKKLGILVSLIAAALIFLVNDLFVKIWVGENLFSGIMVSFWLALSFIVQFVILPNRVILATTLHRLKWQNSLRVAEGILHLILAVILGRKFGIEGVIAGGIIASVVGSNVVFNIFCDELFKMKSIKTNTRIYFFYLILLFFPLVLIVQFIPGIITRIALLIITILLGWVLFRKIVQNAYSEGIFDSVRLPLIAYKVFNIKRV